MENAMIKVILIKPLDGYPEGTERELDKPDADRLIEMGAVRLVTAPAAAPQNKAMMPSANKAPAKA
jgi:hypothetical protein